MPDDSLAIIIVVVLIILGCIFSGRRGCCGGIPKSVGNQRRFPVLESNQQDNIYNISGQVQGQGQWPTHDNHVSLDHFTITNETKVADEPPSYEEAMSLAVSNSSVVPAVVPTTPPPPFPADTESPVVNAAVSIRN